ncbi:MAG: autotransporter assembly complex family protein [Pseudomonadota bacterium]
MSAAQVVALDAVDLQVSGPDTEVLTEDIRGVLRVQDALEAEEDSGRAIVAAALSDYRRVVETLYGAGYYSSSVSIRLDGREAAGIELLAVPATVDRVTVTVDPGTRFSFGRAVVAPLAPGDTLPDSFAPGQVAAAGAVKDAVQSSVEGWRAEGNAKAAAVGQSVTADHRANTLDVAIDIDPGPVLTFGNLIITTDSKVRDRRIRQIAGLPSGARFDPEELERVASRLRRAGAFGAVGLTEAETANADGTLDIELSLSDPKQRRYGFGVEVSSLEGATVSGYWLHRNLLGGAERLRFDFEVAQIGTADGQGGGTDYSTGVRIERPADLGPDRDLFAFAEFEQLDEPTFQSRSLELGVGVEQIFSPERSGSVAVGYLYSETQDDLGDREFRFLTLPVSYTWDRRDDVLDATQGFYLRGEVTPFVGLAGSSSGLRGELDARVYRSLGERVTLAGRGQIGSVAGAGIDDVPSDFLFFSGGSATVRGQPYQSLTVTNDSGQETGGRSFLGLSGEARVAVRDQIDLVGFYDVGYVGGESFYDGSGAWHSGAGLGIRYDTALGPIRLDAAVPVSGDTGDGLQVYIGIGQSF